MTPAFTPDAGGGKTTGYSLRLARYSGLEEAIATYAAGRASLGETNREPLNLLDVGVGRGRTFRYLEANGHDGGISFFGIDNSPRRLDGVFGADRWRLQRMDAEQGLSFRDDSFDIVVCEQVLEHLAEPGAAIREFSRVLRPGGLLVVGVPSFPPGIASIRRHIIPWFDRLRGHTRSHRQAYSLRTFVEMLHANGRFDVQAVRGFRFVSGGPLRPLERYRWWYRLNRSMGGRFPSWTTEIQVVAHRSAV